MMTRLCVLAILLALGACEHHPPPLNQPAENAPVWNLNVGQQQGTNDLMHEPTVGVIR
jgi:hypothetical protein